MFILQAKQACFRSALHNLQQTIISNKGSLKLCTVCASHFILLKEKQSNEFQTLFSTKAKHYQSETNLFFFSFFFTSSRAVELYTCPSKNLKYLSSLVAQVLSLPEGVFGEGKRHRRMKISFPRPSLFRGSFVSSLPLLTQLCIAQTAALPVYLTPRQTRL